MYAALYPILSEICQSHGYSLAIHGSIVRDFDLIAIPWVETAALPEILVQAIRDYFARCYFTTEIAVVDAEMKPHGRRSWIIPIENGSAIDLSVMPLDRPSPGSEPLG
jgi:hypothetical protein